MSGAPYSIERVSPRRVLVRLFQLDQAQGESLSVDLLPKLPPAPLEPQVVFDMNELVSCTTPARERLAELQRRLGAYPVRTAYVADTPRFRGVGLWIAHISGDMNARAFHSLAQAEGWLEAKEGRLDSIQSYLKDKKRKPRGKKKDSKDSKDPKDSKDSKDSKDPKDPKDPKDSKDPKDPKGSFARRFFRRRKRRKKSEDDE